MKKLLIALLAIPLLWSCDELENQQPYSGPDVLRFSSASTTTTELGDVIRIPVVTTRSEALEASITFTSTNATEGVHYTILNSSDQLSFPAGVFSDTLELQIIDNADADGNKDITLALSTSADISIGFPGDVQELGNNQLTIVDDDCPLDLSEFVGTFDVDEDDGAFTYTAGITLGANPNTLLVDNWWGSGLPAEVTFDNSDPSNPIAYVLPQNTGVILNPLGETWVTSRPDAGAAGSTAARDGLPDGSFSTCGLNFTVNVVIYIPAAGTFNGNVKHVFTKQ